MVNAKIAGRKVSRSDGAQQLRRACLAGLALIALLTIAGQFTLLAAIGRRSLDAPLINVAGRQGMLSQRVALKSITIHRAIQQNKQKLVVHEVKELRIARAAWMNGYEALTDQLREFFEHSKEATEIERLLGELRAEQTQMCDAAATVITAGLESAKNPDAPSLIAGQVDRVVESAEQILPVMEEIVKAYNLASQSGMNDLRNTSWLVTEFTIFSLALIGVCIFEPVVRQIRRITTASNQQVQAIDQAFCRVEFAPDGTILDANANFLELMGHSLEDILGRNYQSFVLDDGILCDDRRAFGERLSHGDLRSGEFPRISADGSTKWLHGTYSTVTGSKGDVERIVNYATDITERKRLELGMGGAQNAWARAIEGSTDGHWDYDPLTGAVWYSNRFKEMLGFQPEDFDQFKHQIDSFSERLHPDERDEVMAAMKAHLDEGLPFCVSHRIRALNGQYVWFRTRGLAQRDANDVAVRMSGSVSDITRERNIEESLRSALAQLEHQTAIAQKAANAALGASRTKSEFLANMSHEIRTPLTAILGFSETLLEPSTKAQATEVAKTIMRNGKHLLQIINDILDLSKIESGKMIVECRPQCPIQLVEEVTSLLKVRARNAGLACSIEYNGPIPETIQTDPTRLRQILLNLVGNAIKFTKVGGVKIIASLVIDNGKPAMQFDVQDTGIGIRDDQLKKLFQPFTQADTSTTRKFGGTGLGLTISKRFAELLGGDITVVRNEPGGGATFRVRIDTGPLDGVRMIDGASAETALAPDENSPTSQDATSIDGLRLLLVEDGPDNQRLLQLILGKAGAHVTLKENGQLAVDAALAAKQAGKPFDVILMDMQMPVMDGYIATRLLRKHGYAGPILALTANAMEGDRQKCLDAGCDDYAAKPIQRASLIAQIADCIANTRAMAS